MKSRAEEVVRHLEDWEKLKDTYDDAASEARKAVWDAAKKAIKGKGDSEAVSEFFDKLKDLIDQDMLTGRKATGMTPVLKRYDKVFEKTDAMLKNHVSATDPAWKPYVKENNDCTADFRKANAAVKTNFGMIVERQGAYNRISPNRNGDVPPLAATVTRQLTGKSKAAREVLSGAEKIKSSVESDLQKIWAYFERDKRMKAAS
jgi:hypothetical protein